MEKFTTLEDGQNYLYNNFQNYEVEEVDSTKKECYILFSSNGIYEDSIESFQDIMLKKNRYEWKSIAKVIKRRKTVGKIIYVRDVYKKYYIYGINKEVNSISKTLEKLKVLTEGTKVITIGISSGGYMATIAGCFLNAKKVFSISGQFEIESCLEAKDKQSIIGIERKYLNVVDLVAQNRNVKIYYFCPIGCEFDKGNYELIKQINQVNTFLFASNIHADTVYPFNFPDVFCGSEHKLDQLALKYRGKVINKKIFLINTMTLQGYIDFIIRVLKMKFNIKKLKRFWDVK